MRKSHECEDECNKTIKKYIRTKAKVRRCGFNPWVGKIPWRREWQCTPVFLPGESHGQRGLAGYSPLSHKESDVTKRLTLSFTFWELGSRGLVAFS